MPKAMVLFQQKVEKTFSLITALFRPRGTNPAGSRAVTMKVADGVKGRQIGDASPAKTKKPVELIETVTGFNTG